MAGQIIPRGERIWLVRVYNGRDTTTGKRKYLNKTIHGTKKDAQAYLNKVLHEIDEGTFIEPSKQSFSEYLEQWLETTAKPRLRERTFLEYHNLLKRYVLPRLGGRQLSQITPIDIQTLYTSMQDKGLSPRTVRYTHAVIHSALKQAQRWRLIPQNAAELIDLPKQRRREMSALSSSDASRFLKAAFFDEHYVLFLVAITTGMRPGEYLALQWKDINFETGIISVRRALSRSIGEWKFEEPKTSRSRRTIKLPPTVVKALQAHKIAQNEDRLKSGPEYHNLDLVFANNAGNPLDLTNLVKRHFKPILKRTGLSEKEIRLYDLRHTCATILLEAGENPKVVSERLGHASITLTLDTYSHVLPDMQQRAAEKIELLLFCNDKR